MALPGSLQLSCELGPCRNQSYNRQPLRVLGRSKLPVLTSAPSFHVPFLKLECRRSPLSCNITKPTQVLSCKSRAFKCHSFLQPDQPSDLPVIKAAATTLARSCNMLQISPGIIKLLPAVAIIVFAIWGVNPLMCQMRKQLLQSSDSNWKKSTTHYIVTSYLQPLLLWVGAILICRALEPVVLPTETGQIVKERLLNFVRSLSTVLSFAYCLSSVIQQTQNFFVESADTSETRNMGFQFAGKAVYSAVWVAAFALFMELLGFSTQKWVTAGGLGTVLITLAGREIFTNFLSSVMIHATRPFVVNEWIQTKIEGYEVSGTVEHVGWWSPTIIRGEDGEAVHIPNHQFTVNIVRNLSQKTHWRIKTHLAISHWDVSKINNIVADMRKVLAKNPQVEQQRLHRRVFLENINPESQALLILVSCFVKTSHFEEYLCVKETILLDLLRVIGHHGARLATPVRTLQKIYSDDDLENIPFVDSLGRGPGTVSNRPLAVIESPYKTNADDKTRNHKTGRTKHDTKTDAKVGPTVVSDSNVRETPLNSKSDAKAVTSNSNTNENSKNGESSMVRPSVGKDEPMESDLNATFKGSVGVPPDTSSSNSKASGFALDDLTQKDLKLRQKTDTDNLISSSSSSNADIAGGHHRPSKQLDERKAAEQPLSCRTVIEENIVLGVALEGSKRTLPIEDGMDDSIKDSKEMAACQAEDN